MNVNPLICTHCGEITNNQSFSIKAHIFCCNGCKVVYQFLSDNGLNNYYELQKTPGTVITNKQENKDFSYLDDLDLLESIHEFYSEKVAKITLLIPSIHCSSCVWLLEKLPSILNGVQSSRCNLFQSKLTINYCPKIVDLSQIISQIYQLGYETELNFDNKKTNSSQTTDENLETLIRLGVAAFCLINTMTLALPEYLSPGEVTPTIKKAFDYISFILTLPVVFFSAKPYFNSASKSLKFGIVNWDVPIVLGILSLFFTSIYALFTNSGQLYFDSLCGFLFFLLLGEWVKKRSFKKLNFDRNFNSFLPLGITIEENENFKTIPLDKLVKGQKVLIRSKEIIPCDGTLLSNEAQINYSFITGEFPSVNLKKGEDIKAGGLVENSSIFIQSENSAKESYLMKLWQELEDIKSSDKKEKFPFAFIFSIIVILLAIITFFIWLPTSFDLAILHMTSILIVACPCALALSKPYTLSNAQRILSKHGLFLKKSETLEKFYDIEHIIFDKTGTLTQINLGIFQNSTLTNEHLSLIKSCAILSQHPICTKIVSELSKVSTLVHSDFLELEGLGITGIFNEKTIKIGKAKHCFTSKQKNYCLSKTYITINDKIVHSFSYFDQPRQGVKKLIQNLQKSFDISLLTGDQKKENHPIFDIFNDKSTLLFNLSPEDKLNYIKKTKQQCLMVGDGMNDAGALRASTLGFSICENLQGFYPSCDGIILASNITELSKYFRYAIICKRIVKLSLLLSICYNFFGLYFAMTGKLTPLISAVLMPLSSLSVMFFTWFMTKRHAKKIFNTEKK